MNVLNTMHTQYRLSTGNYLTNKNTQQDIAGVLNAQPCYENQVISIK